jgi:HSP20 family protein
MNTQVATTDVGTILRRQDPFPRLLDWFEGWMPGDMGVRAEHARSLRVEEFTRNGNFVVRAEIPGIDPEKDVEVSITDGILTIHGERKEEHREERRSEFYYGSFVRTLVLPKGVDESSVKATYEDGILEVCVTLPTQAPESTKVPVVHKK